MNKELGSFIKSMKQYDSSEEKNKLYDKIQALADEEKLSIEDSKEIVTEIFRGEILQSNFDEKLACFLDKDGETYTNDYEEQLQESNDYIENKYKDLNTEYDNTESKIIKNNVDIRKKSNKNSLDELMNYSFQSSDKMRLDKRKNYVYKVVEAPGGSSHIVFEDLLNSNTGNGWMFYSTQSVVQEIPSGCSLFSPPKPPKYKTVIFLIFVKEKNE